MNGIRVVVVDDSAEMRDALAELIDLTEGMACVGTAEDGFEGIQMVRQLEPSAIVMDLRMPAMGGIDAVRALREAGVATPIIMLTAYGDEALMAEAGEAGVTRYVIKGTAPSEILTAIWDSVSGGNNSAP